MKNTQVVYKCANLLYNYWHMRLDNVSVIMPAYNAAAWLPKSIPRVEAALKRAGVKHAEIIVVDDGSSDNTAKVAEGLKLGFPIRVVSQPNSGRFMARYNGVEVAKYKYVLFIDTRIYIGEDSFKYIASKIDPAKKKVVWTSHVIIDRAGNPYARFWEGLTFIAWRKYFANPRELSYGIKEFDYYPKGTTCFFVPKDVIHEANVWFTTQSKNAKAANDDTLLIRRIAENFDINISPKFYCTYHARTNLKQYCKHVFHRGKVFVDGFLRRDGNRFFWPLVAFLFLSLVTPVALVIFPQVISRLVMAALASWLLELIFAMAMRVPYKDALSLWLLSPLFAVVYGLGIWKAVIDIYLRPAKSRE